MTFSCICVALTQMIGTRLNIFWINIRKLLKWISAQYICKCVDMNTPHRSCSTVFRDAQNDSEKVTAFLSLSLSVFQVTTRTREWRPEPSRPHLLTWPRQVSRCWRSAVASPAPSCRYVNVKQERVEHRMTSKQALRPVIQHNIFKHSVSRFVS